MRSPANAGLRLRYFACGFRWLFGGRGGNATRQPGRGERVSVCPHPVGWLSEIAPEDGRQKLTAKGIIFDNRPGTILYAYEERKKRNKRKNSRDPLPFISLNSFSSFNSFLSFASCKRWFSALPLWSISRASPPGNFRPAPHE